MSSLFLKKTFKEYSKVNKLYSFVNFISSQFFIDNQSIILKERNKFTSEIYKQNKNSLQYNTKINLIIEDDAPGRNFIRRSTYLYIYTLYEVYLREYYIFLLKFDSNLVELHGKESIPFGILNNISSDIYKKFNKIEILTFDYIRLRRNNIVHSNNEAKGELDYLIRTKGHSLNKFWNKRLKSGLYGLKFNSYNTQNFDENELYDLINIFRALIKQIDKEIEALCKEAIVNAAKELFTQEFKSKLNGLKAERIEKKFAKYLRNLYGIQI